MKTILLADDEKNLRRLVRTTLEGASARFVEVADGEAALVAARLIRPELLILDWMMPGKSGIEVAEELQRDPETRDLPIIILTARSQARDRERCFEAGAVSYLAKPFSPLDLLHQVELVLGDL